MRRKTGGKYAKVNTQDEDIVLELDDHDEFSVAKASASETVIGARSLGFESRADSHVFAQNWKNSTKAALLMCNISMFDRACTITL